MKMSSVEVLVSNIALPETLILFRHGVFEGNEHARLTGQAAEEAMAEGLGLHDFDDKELLGWYGR